MSYFSQNKEHVTKQTPKSITKWLNKDWDPTALLKRHIFARRKPNAEWKIQVFLIFYFAISLIEPRQIFSDRHWRFFVKGDKFIIRWNVLTCRNRREILRQIFRYKQKKLTETDAKTEKPSSNQMKLTFTTGITVLVVRLLNTNAAVEIVEYAAFIELPILAWQWLLTALIN